jgi:hypothetical protein
LRYASGAGLSLSIINGLTFCDAKFSDAKYPNQALLKNQEARSLLAVYRAALLVFVVVESFPEADPDIEQSQAAAQSTKKSGGDENAQPGIGEKKIIIRPLGRPRQNYEQHACHRADQYEKKDGGAVQPQLQWLWSRRFEQRRSRFSLGRHRAVIHGQFLLWGHRTLQCDSKVFMWKCGAARNKN